MVDDWIRLDLANDGRQRLGKLEQRGMDNSTCEYHAIEKGATANNAQAWQTFYLFAVITWTQNRGWSWSHTIFFVMHCLVMLMKQHSYAFYNGHLSELYKAREALKKTLKQLENKVPVETSSPTTLRPKTPPTEDIHLETHSKKSMRPAADLSEITQAIESDEGLDLEQIQSFESIIKSEMHALKVDLQGKATSPSNAYPNNLSLKKHYEFTLLPSLVYELEYPRTDKIDWRYVVEKAAATAGVLFIMQLVSQTFIYPIVMHSVRMKEDGMPVRERVAHFPWMISDLIFPFMMEYMMTWFVLPPSFSLSPSALLTRELGMCYLRVF